MKLADWPGGFEYPGVSEQIPARMAQLDLTEDAALVATDETGNPRVLIAADGALPGSSSATGSRGSRATSRSFSSWIEPDQFHAPRECFDQLLVFGGPES